MKSYHFFKICKRFGKKRKKNTYAVVNEKTKTEMGLGKLPLRKTAPSPNSNANPKPNPDSDRRGNFPRGQFSGHQLRYVGLCFITGFLYVLFNHFLVLQAHSQPSFCFLISG